MPGKDWRVLMLYFSNKRFASGDLARMSRFFHATMTLVVLTVLAISAYGMWASGLRVPVAQVLPKIGMYSLVRVHSRMRQSLAHEPSAWANLN